MTKSESRMLAKAMELLLLSAALVSVAVIVSSSNSPLYICIAINSIVALIAASSTFLHHAGGATVDAHLEPLSEVEDTSEPFLVEEKVDIISAEHVSAIGEDDLAGGGTATMDATWEAIKGTTAPAKGVVGRGVRREESVGVEELNKKVEDFIKRFNDEMRLQRQESDQRFWEMINSGL